MAAALRNNDLGLPSGEEFLETGLNQLRQKTATAAVVHSVSRQTISLA